MSADPYEVFGVGYAGLRRPDPRIVERIDRALGGARTIVDVGAGTGSYERPARTVLAVEPSRTMIRQRPPDASPVVRGSAEALPMRDGAVDAALAVLTIHHWPDAAAGLRELVRVAERQVVLLVDHALFSRALWLVRDYLPEVGQVELDFAGPDLVVTELERLGRHVDVVAVPVPADCTDGFLGAYWRRPHAYLDPAVRAAASGLARLADDVVDPAMARLRGDLDSGRWHARHADLLDRDELDLGYRLVVGRPPDGG